MVTYKWANLLLPLFLIFYWIKVVYIFISLLSKKRENGKTEHSLVVETKVLQLHPGERREETINLHRPLSEKGRLNQMHYSSFSEENRPRCSTERRVFRAKGVMGSEQGSSSLEVNVVRGSSAFLLMATLTSYWHIINHCPCSVKWVVSTVAKEFCNAHHPLGQLSPKYDCRGKSRIYPKTWDTGDMYIRFSNTCFIVLVPFQGHVSILFLLFCLGVSFFNFVNFISFFIPVFLHQCFNFSSLLPFFVPCDKRE